MTSKSDNRKTRVVTVRLTEKQYQELETSANDYRVSVAERARMGLEAFQGEARQLFIIAKYLEYLIYTNAKDDTVLPKLKAKISEMADDFSLREP